ncbi:hypothetical protein AB0I00_05280 [Streptomyces sp. NPDC050803]|uniref:hypothetical protein n=1 Tax=Streptomyces sp. NPDC050803 TaxID=3154635 RepID=UPI00343BFD7E
MEGINEYPWTWTSGHVDEWMTYLVAEKKRARSTIRCCQDALKLFCDYITSPYYQWPEVCEARFGTHPVQVCHERKFNSSWITPMTKWIARSGWAARVALAAYRDATVFKVIYAWGLRCNETSRLDTTDFYRNPKAPELGRFGSLQVRYDKASRGSGPRRRMVQRHALGRGGGPGLPGQHPPAVPELRRVRSTADGAGRSAQAA